MWVWIKDRPWVTVLGLNRKIVGLYDVLEYNSMIREAGENRAKSKSPSNVILNVTLNGYWKSGVWNFERSCRLRKFKAILYLLFFHDSSTLCLGLSLKDDNFKIIEFQRFWQCERLYGIVEYIEYKYRVFDIYTPRTKSVNVCILYSQNGIFWLISISFSESLRYVLVECK